MNTDTGWTGKLPDALLKDVKSGEPLADYADELKELAAKQDDLASELSERVEKGEPIVAVSEEVVQRLRLGDRELRRRKQRRR